MGEIVKMPQLGETVTEGTILRWLVAVGDEVKEDDPILEISTDKVDTEVPSPFSGKVTSLLVEEGETVEVGVGLMELGGDDSTKEEAAKVVEEAIEVELPKEDLTSNIESSKTDIVTKAPKDLKLSPIVRKLAGENNLDLTQVTGTGKNNRITRKDIEVLLKSEPIPSVSEKNLQEEKHVSSENDKQKVTSTGSIPRLRKRIAENMILSKQTSAHVMTSVEVDYENISVLRNKIKGEFKQKEGFSLTFLPFISVATINALREFPVVNSSFDLENNTHDLHDFINLGIAVDLNREGLLVGTIKDSDSFNLRGLARKITEVSSILRNKEYGLEDVTGSTFTISNNGSFNSFITSPIINQPNVAILSTESIKKKPVVIESADGSDSIAIRNTGVLSLTWDHRVFDGSTALLFLNSIKDKLENHPWADDLN
ncbi:2-oxo acid dehydrogenase subunit E2 [Candidatus Actinomarina sp.]|jgi:2-oxoglutarate dehydrogenase E2 component (dihydrolipoamide succinyltransferase)|nr:2-oxo acid dehydrogenase subunit E2 [Candidatus Actinomarina sp.]